MATYAVGDIQGCYAPLRRLLDQAAFDPAQDQLWSVGDLVNRGPQSLDTLRFLKSLGSAFIGVLGNHDLHFLASASGAYSSGKIQTLRPLLEAPDCVALFEWVRHLPLAHRATLNTAAGEHKFLLVHAGIAPGWKFSQARSLAAEVEATLQGPAFLDYLRMMYGDLPDTWSNTLSGMERLRVITNVLTRIRFCTAAGQLNLKVKAGPSAAPTGYRPWYEFQQPKTHKTILFGHWATLNGKTGRGDIIGLDTGCVWGRCMTLLRVEDGKRFTIACSEAGT